MGLLEKFPEVRLVLLYTRRCLLRRHSQWFVNKISEELLVQDARDFVYRCWPACLEMVAGQIKILMQNILSQNIAIVQL